MGNEIEKFSYNLTQCYLELARSAFTSIQGKKEETQKIANALFAITSISIIYSYTAIEAFVSRQFYRICETRNSNTEEGKRFNKEFPNIQKCADLKNNRSIWELKDKIKALCRLLGYRQICDEDAKLWQVFNELVKDARHFIIHPLPDPDKFQEKMTQIMMENRVGLYVEVAEKIIKHFYDQAKIETPDWLKENKLFKSRGYILLDDN